MQESSNKVDDESKKALIEVKKGRVRKFVIIKEGVQIDRLYVFKKGPYDKYVRLAKKDGVRGQAFWGTVSGDGLDILFELSRADGFEHPPGKDIRLKEFIKEETGFKFEPVYVIVDKLPTVDESDEEEDQEEGQEESQEEGKEEAQEEAQEKTQPDVAQAAETGVGTQAEVAATSAAAEDQGDKFTRLLKKILPHVKKALAASTSLSEELRNQVRQAQDLGRRREFEQGLVTLRTVAELAKKALSEAPAPTSDAAADPAQFAAQIQKLRTRIDEMQVQETSVAREISTRMRDAETLAGRQKLDRASAALPQIERLLDRAQAEMARRRQWEDRFAELEPRYNGSLHAGSPDVAALRAIMQYATAQADRKRYVKALVGLGRLDSLMSQSA